jgi:glutamate decarboxylase
MSASLPSSTVNSGNHPIGRTTDSDKAVEEKELIETLREEVEHLRNSSTLFSASNYTSELHYFDHEGEHLPLRGMSARHVRERIIQLNQLDNKPRLNTSSYVNVVMEPEEEEVALLGLGVNLADGSVYPSSVNLHDTVVNMIAKMWHAPIDASITDDDGRTKYTGAGTVGSTEACLLAGLALKFRWREWYRTRNNLSKREILGVIPNVVISTCYQAAWEKFFRYMDVEPRFVKPSIANKMRVDASDIAALCDDKTLGVVGILGNHYNGAYDPIWDIDSEIDKVNKMNGWQIGIHVDAASGGFIAPFQQDMPPWDFRLPNVLSISTSGHKFGESSCGTGWVVFRHRENLAEHISISGTIL